jgi:DNA-binding IclR family transcriptional regulator
VASELRSIRRAGYAHSDSEAYQGVAGMSAPIFDWRGVVIGSIGLVGPSTRLTRRWRLAVAPEVIAAAARITARMTGALEDER